MNVNEGMPKTIEKEREEYIVKKLKEMLEDAFYTKLTERPEVEKINDRLSSSCANGQVI